MTAIRADWKRISLPFLLLLFAGILGAPALRSADPARLDLMEQLSRPEVKVLVVEFYSVYCQPCMEAVPKWRKLQEAYRGKGLRFVVVSVDKELCSDPEWTPDEKICDPTGQIQSKFDVKGLPTTLVMSWEGVLSSKEMGASGVDNVIQSVQTYFKDTHYRVEIDPTVEVYGDKYAISGNPEVIRRYAAEELRKQSKFDVMSDNVKPRARKKGEFCPTELPPNSTLRITLFGDAQGNRTLTLELEKEGCTKGSSTQRYRGQGFNEDLASIQAAVRLAVADLMKQLVRVKEFRGGGGDWFDEKEMVVAEFAPQPEGAVVILDGKLLCQKTPCRKPVSQGTHEVSIQAEEHLAETRPVDFRKGTTIRWKLTPDYGWVSVGTDPSGLAVKVDGKEAGTSPVSRVKVSPGRHEVTVDDRCYEPAREGVTVERGKETTVSLKAVAREGGIEVTAEDEEGNAVEGEVWAEGKKLGVAPGRFKVNICTKEVEIRTKQGSTTKAVAVKERKVVEVKVVVNTYGIEWVSIPGGTFEMGCSEGDTECFDWEKPRHRVTIRGFRMMKYEVTQGQYRKVMGENPSNFTNCGDNCPVEQVDWNQSKAFCEKIGGRLPTEEEWEYAARGGTKTKYYCGGDASCLGTIAWYDANSGGTTHPVGQKRANAFGLFDMSGNVWEWTGSCDSSDYNSSQDCSQRVLRGGSWDVDAGRERSSLRGWNGPTNRLNYNGFRCSRD